jgi:hypothetical protein
MSAGTLAAAAMRLVPVKFSGTRSGSGPVILGQLNVLLHAQCRQRLPGRPTAMAPAWYVLCDQAPHDQARLESWRHLPAGALMPARPTRPLTGGQPITGGRPRTAPST